MLDVFGDADDVGARHRVGVDADALADGILVRAKASSPLPSLTTIARGACSTSCARDAAAAEDARAEGREIVRRDGVQVELSKPTHCVDPLHVEPDAPRAPERHGDLRARVRDAGDRRRGAEQALAQADRRDAVQRFAAHVQIDEQHGIDVVAQLHVVDVLEAAHEEPGADEQHHRQRALEHEQRDSGARSMESPSRAIPP